MVDIFGGLGVPGGGSTASTFGSPSQITSLFGGHPAGGMMGSGLTELQRLFLMQSLLGQGQGLMGNAMAQPGLMAPPAMAQAPQAFPDPQTPMNFGARSFFVG